MRKSGSSAENSQRLNSTLREKRELIELVQSKDLTSEIIDLSYDWRTGAFRKSSLIARLFREYGWVNEDGTFNRFGKLVYGRLVLHFDKEQLKNQRLGQYDTLSLIRSGKNSIIFEGRHKLLNRPVILKVVRPGASEDVYDAFRRLSAMSLPRNVILPTDILEVELSDVAGSQVTLPCIVFPKIDGMSLSDFLRLYSSQVNPHLIITFVKQIAEALAALERGGAYHGDLHAQNILVGKAFSGSVEFNLIDVSFDAIGSQSMEEARNNDRENFSALVWRFLNTQKQRNPRISLRKFLGSRYFFKIRDVITNKQMSFVELVREFGASHDYEQYIEEKNRFLVERFKPPASFRLQRYEEFTDPSIAARLFVPLPELREKISEFSNVYVSGNRGSGKSTYLASLGFFPTIDAPVVDFRTTFGVYFPCRQGEFRAIVNSPGRLDADRRAALMHLVLLKTVRRIIEILSKAIATGKLQSPIDVQPLLAGLGPFLPEPGVVVVDSSIISTIENMLSSITNAELSFQPDAANQLEPRATCADLVAFLKAVRASFAELSFTRFHLLFDDAGRPYVPAEVQMIINDMMLFSNAVFCVKISAEKHTFDFISSEGKILEVGHDYFEHDISFSLYFGVKETGLLREQLEDYFKKIVEGRLAYFGFRSTNITDYLGDDPGHYDRLMARLVVGSRRAYYSGWSDVWHIADRTPRTLLEIVSEIFATAGVDSTSESKMVDARTQDRAIRTISEKRLQSLSQISGSIQINGRKVSLGRQLYEITVTIGSTFRAYLKSQVQGSASVEHPRTHLALERNDLAQFDPTAERLLQELVTFGVLDSGKAFIARDDQRKKPIYVLNRIFCPAFSIGYRRDDHVPLSGGKLEQLLLAPYSFRKGGTAVLRAVTLESRGQGDFFGYGEGTNE